VQENKAEAEKALKKIPQIQRNINEAETKTQDARTNLAGAEKDADDAKELAEVVQSEAEKANVVQIFKEMFIINFLCKLIKYMKISES
jgi:hypothetical protein